MPTIADVYRAIPTPITAVAARVGEQDIAMVLSSFVALSDDPALVGISVKRGSSTWPLLREATSLGINILTGGHSGLIDSYSLPSHERLVGSTYRADAGAIIIADAPTSLVCHIEREIEMGDHIFVVLAVDNVLHDPKIGRPIVHHQRRVTELMEYQI
ncbi:flavin reductase family protein [Corynebacterium tapiri]|uniref:flavin reductase family protein n=1 Tax=Corynebacterium tapiri TaxID=1448266 RepID=UPI0015D58913|nr:flavin reductase family protein [Corynebacterium tapiri]